MNIDDILKRYQLSSRSLATLLDVSPATINYWHNNYDSEIPKKFEDDAQKTFSSIDQILEFSGYEPKKVIPLILEFKKSPFWKDWPHLVLTLDQSLKTDSLKPDSPINQEIIRYIGKQARDAKIISKSPKNLKNVWEKFDICFATDEKKYIFVNILEEAISLPNIVNLLTDIQNAHKTIPSSSFYIFANQIGNSVRFAIEDFDYITLVQTKINEKFVFQKISKTK